MSREIQYDSSQRAVVDNLYAAIFNSALQVWNGSAFVELATAPTASACLVQLSELGAGPLYAADMPAGIISADPGLLAGYTFQFFDQTSASLSGGTLLSALTDVGRGSYQGSLLSSLLQYVSGCSGPQQFTATALAKIPPAVNISTEEESHRWG